VSTYSQFNNHEGTGNEELEAAVTGALAEGAERRIGPRSKGTVGEAGIVGGVLHVAFGPDTIVKGTGQKRRKNCHTRIGWVGRG
jgi:hypothetical protein